jgi:hypothetical protein
MSTPVKKIFIFRMNGCILEAMGKVLFIFLLIFVFCASVFTQKGERILCPYVDVADAPQGARVGELVTFRADVDTDGKEYDLKYYWHVNEEAEPRRSLVIVSGQGTPVIAVAQVKGSVTAIVEIGGLPQDCLRTSSETAFVDPSSAGGDCPGIELTGPAKSIGPGEMLEYSVHVETGGEEIKLEYIWAAVYPDVITGKRKKAEIVSGQGTPDVRIKMPGDRITVSVIIGGIREGCPVMASETVSYTPAAEAEMLEDFRGPVAKFDKARIEKIKAAQKNDPAAILYVLVGCKPANSAKCLEKKVFVMETFSKHERYRIVFSNVDESDVMQIWLVKPGTAYPKFKTPGGK